MLSDGAIIGISIACVLIFLLLLPPILLRIAPAAVVRGATKFLAFLARLKTKSIDAGGFNWSYYESRHSRHSNQETIVLIHGYGTNKESWSAFARYLVKHHYRVICPDLPGNGYTTPLECDSYDVISQVRRLDTFITAVLGEERFHLGGLSLGGHVAGVYAATFPHRLKSLLLMCPAGVPGARRSKLAEEYLVHGKPNPLLVDSAESMRYLLDHVFFNQPYIPTSVLTYYVNEKQERLHIDRKIVADLEVGEREGLLKQALNKIRTRTMLIWGDRDELLDISSVPVIESNLPEKPFTVIMNDVGHALQAECPKEVAEHYMRFLQTDAVIDHPMERFFGVRRLPSATAVADSSTFSQLHRNGAPAAGMDQEIMQEFKYDDEDAPMAVDEGGLTRGHSHPDIMNIGRSGSLQGITVLDRQAVHGLPNQFLTGHESNLIASSRSYSRSNSHHDALIDSEASPSSSSADYGMTRTHEDDRGAVRKALFPLALEAPLARAPPVVHFGEYEVPRTTHPAPAAILADNNRSISANSASSNGNGFEASPYETSFKATPPVRPPNPSLVSPPITNSRTLLAVPSPNRPIQQSPNPPEPNWHGEPNQNQQHSAAAVARANESHYKHLSTLPAVAEVSMSQDSGVNNDPQEIAIDINPSPTPVSDNMQGWGKIQSPSHADMTDSYDSNHIPPISETAGNSGPGKNENEFLTQLPPEEPAIRFEQKEDIRRDGVATALTKPLNQLHIETPAGTTPAGSNVSIGTGSVTQGFRTSPPALLWHEDKVVDKSSTAPPAKDLSKAPSTGAKAEQQPSQEKIVMNAEAVQPAKQRRHLHVVRSSQQHRRQASTLPDKAGELLGIDPNDSQANASAQSGR